MRAQIGTLLVAAALLLPLTGIAAAQEGPQRPRIMVMAGEGLVQAPPDMATITLGVVAGDESASAALAANNAAMSDVIDALKAEGIESRDLQTSGFSVQPILSQPPRNYDHSVPFKPEILGYRVRNNVTARIRDLARVGAILDLSVNLGANSVSGPNFGVADPQPLEDEARRVAMADAKRKAELYAEAAGVTLGPVVRIEESVQHRPQTFEMRAAMPAAVEADVPIESGELTFRAQVSVSWRLRN